MARTNEALSATTRAQTAPVAAVDVMSAINELDFRKLDALGRRQVAIGKDNDKVEVFIQTDQPLSPDQKQQILALLERPRTLEQALAGVTSVVHLKALVRFPFVRRIDVVNAVA